MRKSGILRSFGVFAPQDDVPAIYSTAGPQIGDAYAPTGLLDLEVLEVRERPKSLVSLLDVRDRDLTEPVQ